MKFSFLVAFLAMVTNYCFASDEQLRVSPNKKFAVSFMSGEYPCLISLPSREIMVADLLDEQSRTISVLWSEDSSRFVCWVQQARFTAFAVYGQRKDFFEALFIPDIELPFEPSLKDKETRCIGESQSPVRWASNDTLIINKTGTINFYENHEPKGGFDYSYDITIHFDKAGKGQVIKIKKAPIHRD